MDFLAQPFRADMSSESQELCFSTTIERTALPKASLYFAQFRFESAVVQTSAYTAKQSFAFELSFSLLISTKTARILFSDGYLPYGQDNGRAQGSETYKFTGNSYSSTNGLYYEFQRWYDNSTGRFISQDPLPGHLRNPQSLDAFSYVLNQPTRLIDPTGMGADCKSETVCQGGGAGIGTNPASGTDVSSTSLPAVDVGNNDLETNTLTSEQTSTFGRALVQQRISTISEN